QILSGIDIFSGTTQCPDRSTDDSAVFEVVATGGLPLTYTWSIITIKTFQFVPGYDANPGDGAGQLMVDFTDSIFQGITQGLVISCTVEDGVNPPISADALQIYLDCILFKADLNDNVLYDNQFWKIMDKAGDTTWMLVGGIDQGTNLTGTGALWQDDTGGVAVASKGMLVCPPIIIPGFMSAATVKITHSYSFDPVSMGGNIKIGKVGTLTSVGIVEMPISSGQDYDLTLTDPDNAMYPQSVFSAPNNPSPAYISYIDVPGSLLADVIQIGFSAASGTLSYNDGGWLIDNVLVTGTL
ncbi:MAG: hypothetical protein ABIC40_03515, partial [bacterium]